MSWVTTCFIWFESELLCITVSSYLEFSEGKVAQKTLNIISISFYFYKAQHLAAAFLRFGRSCALLEDYNYQKPSRLRNIYRISAFWSAGRGASPHVWNNQIQAFGYIYFLSWRLKAVFCRDVSAVLREWDRGQSLHSEGTVFTFFASIAWMCYFVYCISFPC